MHATLLLLLVCTCGAQSLTIVYNVTEHSPPDTPIGNLTADIYRQLRLTNGPALSFVLLQCNKLAINVHGDLVVSEDMDREDIPTIRCSVAVNRLDASDNKVTIPNQVTLKINVVDVNDEVPRWDVGESITIEFMENELKAVRPLPLAIDNDATGTRLTYNKTRAMLSNGSRAASDPFQLSFGPTNLLVSLVGRLDYETAPEYSFRVVAWDGKHNASLEVLVRVRDVNEYAPQFSNSSYAFSLPEDFSPYSGNSFAQITATDADGTDREGALRYSIANSQMFEIDDEGYLKLQRELNYEQERQHTFLVIARDHGQLSASATVTVSVIDVNDMPPRITGICKTGMCSSIGVMEDDPPGQTDLKIYVSDDDSGRFGDVQCVLSSDSDTSKFYLTQDGTSKVYMLNTRVRFDRESTPNYVVTVVCEDDGGAEKKSSDMRINVHVLDRNDCAPRLANIEPHAGSSVQVHVRDGVHLIEVLESANVGSALAALRADDCDEANGPNSKVNFRLVEETAFASTLAQNHHAARNGTFSLSADGTLSLSSTLDREATSDYQIKVLLTDEGSPSLNYTSTIRIRVLDVVDTPPRFSNQSYRFILTENARVGYSVAQLNVNDPDEETLNGLNFKIVDWPGQTDGCISLQTFSVDHTGMMKTLSEINREACPQYLFQVVVSDSAGLRDTARVQVIVLDENDNAPRFLFPNQHNNSIRVNFISADLPITKLSAIDADENPECPISYSLKTSPGKPDLFYVDSYSGEVRLKRQLTGADGGLHRLTVEASDCGPRRHNVTQTLLITIEKDVEPYEEVQHTTGYVGAQQRPNTGSSHDNFVLMICLLSVFGCMIALALVALVVLCKRFSAPRPDDSKTRRRLRKRQNRSTRENDVNNNEQSTKMMLAAPPSTVRKSASFNHSNKCDASFCERENADNEMNIVVCEGCKLGTCEMADTHIDKLREVTSQPSDMLSPYSCKTEGENSVSEFSEDTASEKNSPSVTRSKKMADGTLDRCVLSHCAITTQEQLAAANAVGVGLAYRSDIGSPTFSAQMQTRIVPATDVPKKRLLTHTVPRRPPVNAPMCNCPECAMNSAAFSGMTLPAPIAGSWLSPAQSLGAPVVVPLATKQVLDAEMMSFIPRSYDVGARSASRAITKEQQVKDAQSAPRSSSVTEQQCYPSDQGTRSLLQLF